MKEKSGVEIEPEPVTQKLREHPFLRGLTREQLVLLNDCALPARFHAGETIFREGEQAHRFFLITSGKVVLESGTGYGEPVVIETIGAGELLGWSWMIPPYRWHFTARAIEPTEAIFFASAILREYCERDHSLGFELHKRMSAVMARRLQLARKKLLSVHAHGASLEPVPHLSPFMEQELDTDTGTQDRQPQFREGAD